MCIKIIKDNVEFSYNIHKPIAEQIQGASQVLVNYKPNDEEIECFLEDIQYAAAAGIDWKVSVKVNYGEFLDGYKLKKQVKKALSDIDMNEIIKLMVLSQHDTDKKLEELYSLCQKER